MFHVRLAHSNCKSLALIRSLMAPVTLLILATFLLHSVPSIPDLSKTHPKYLNSETCSKQIPFTWISYSNHSSPFSTITLFLPPLNFSPLLLYTSTNYPTFILRSSSNTPHRSFAYKRPGNLYSLPSSQNLIPLLPIYIHWITKGTWYTLPHPTILNHLVSPLFTLTQTELSTYS